MDYCETGDDKLIQTLVLDKFKGDLELLSMDKVVPVRLEVARIFGDVL